MHELGLWTILKIGSGRNGYVSNCYPLVWKQFDGKYFESLCGTGVHSELRAFMAAEKLFTENSLYIRITRTICGISVQSQVYLLSEHYTLRELPVQVDDKFKTFKVTFVPMIYFWHLEAK